MFVLCCVVLCCTSDDRLSDCEGHHLLLPTEDVGGITHLSHCVVLREEEPVYEATGRNGAGSQPVYIPLVAKLSSDTSWGSVSPSP